MMFWTGKLLSNTQILSEIRQEATETEKKIPFEFNCRCRVNRKDLLKREQIYQTVCYQLVAFQSGFI